MDIPEPESLWEQPRFGSIATRGAGDELLPFLGSSIGERHLRRNYVKDPHELVNRYDDPAYAGVVKELKARLAERRQQIGDDGR